MKIASGSVIGRRCVIISFMVLIARKGWKMLEEGLVLFYNQEEEEEEKKRLLTPGFCLLLLL